MSRVVYVNGSYVPENEGKVSIFDRGFLFADGIYEVTAVINGKLVDYEPHAERLERSLNEISMAWPCSKAELRQMHEELIKRNKLDEGIIYIQVTRGSADRDFKFPKEAKSTLIGFTQVQKLLENPNAPAGVKVVTIPDIRWARRDIKSVMLLAPVLGKQRAYEEGAFEGWMVEDGKVTEGTSSNAYIVKDGKVITRPLSNSILAGCTRRSLFRMAKEEGVVIEERLFTPEEAYAADEAFLTSASNFVLPIVEIDGKRVGGGQPGPVVRKLREIYLDEARRQAGLK
ncbi:D-amino-acid transaminase [Taklimakanibacter albus]|uniref:D-amino-acid transaminase n=1 Tax=Taklimakanibacter albus TaxID=2800327 RepID=A0ACC5R5V7_9HYPH|nr:D-amino-acid transaminase [Aestuariivirga sp. YIM B02566]MBK1868040.1 D-amino-acid transaminase [Aestuariivirga sp. YIM B02566]